MKYIVWLKFNERAAARHQETPNVWMPNGDGPMGKKTAERVAREVAQDFGIATKFLPEGEVPVPSNRPLDALKHHVTGAVERGEKEPVVEVRA